MMNRFIVQFSIMLCLSAIFCPRNTAAQEEPPVILNLGFFPGFGMNLISKSPDAVAAVNIAVSKQRNITGFQVSGFAGIAADSLKGVQISTLWNSAHNSMKGVQISGIVNYSGTDGQGLQAAAAVNISRGTFSGLQIAGLLNIAEKISGVQIGIINAAREADGAVIGLLNFIADGIMSPAVYADSNRMLYAQYQGGTQQLYTVLYAGTPWNFSGEYMAAGLGLGTRLRAGRYVSFDADISAKQYQLLQAGRENSRFLPPFASLRISCNYSPLKHFSVFGGAAIDLDFADSVPAGAVSPLKFGSSSVTAHPSFFAGLKF